MTYSAGPRVDHKEKKKKSRVVTWTQRRKSAGERLNGYQKRVKSLSIIPHDWEHHSGERVANDVQGELFQFDESDP
jgi:hypothetical protein